MHSQTNVKTASLMQYSFKNYIISHSEANLVANYQIPAIIMTPSELKLHRTVYNFLHPETQHKKAYKSNVEMKYKNAINFGS